MYKNTNHEGEKKKGTEKNDWPKRPEADIPSRQLSAIVCTVTRVCLTEQALYNVG